MKKNTDDHQVADIRRFCDQIDEGLLVSQYQTERLIEVAQAYNQAHGQPLDIDRCKKALQAIATAKQELEHIRQDLAQ
jgi:hypothetical protein